MALVSPTPPTGAPQPGASLSGLLSMVSGAPAMRDVANEALLQKLRPALKIIADLEEHLIKHPEIVPVVNTVLQTRFLKGKGRENRQRPESPQPPLAQGPPVPVPGAAGQAPPGPPQAMRPPIVGY